VRFIESVRQFDGRARELREDAQCQWVRCGFGIVGLVTISHAAPAAELDARIEGLVAHAHSVLDDLPDEQLEVEDLWNVVLLIAVPWTRAGAASEPLIAAVLLRWTRNTIGSRKIILWQGSDLRDYLGPLGLGARGWMPPLGDPLRDTIMSAAAGDDERRVLEVLFKRRIDQADIESLIEVLSRGAAE
jgi:hypothetical protein